MSMFFKDLAEDATAWSRANLDSSSRVEISETGVATLFDDDEVLTATVTIAETSFHFRGVEMMRVTDGEGDTFLEMRGDMLVRMLYL